MCRAPQILSAYNKMLPTPWEHFHERESLAQGNHRVLLRNLRIAKEERESFLDQGDSS